jgi:sugar phosphate isomerase/epimerase
MTPLLPTLLPRRSFLHALGGLAAAATVSPGTLSAAPASTARVLRAPGVKLKLSLNAYSFNQALRSGQMSLEALVRFCADEGVDALDLTGYYLPGYPKVADDAFLHEFKRMTFVNGVSISGTGVRNDFAQPDAAARRADVQLVKEWVEVAAKLGAPVLRVFSGKSVPAGHTFDAALAWMTADMRECAEYGRRHGVMIGLQHHHDFLKTAAETIRLVEAVNSPWFGVILDIGSLRQGDPYAEIEKLIPYAVSWQVKEKVWSGTTELPVDLPRLKRVILQSGYRGFLPVEALGANLTREHIAKFIARVRTEFGL